MKIRIKRGSEGPHHDPYSYTILTLYRQNGDVIEMKCGLGTYLKINEVEYDPPISSPDWESQVHSKFKELTGMSFEKARRIPEILEDRYVKSLPKEDREQYWEMKNWSRHMLANAY